MRSYSDIVEAKDLVEMAHSGAALCTRLETVGVGCGRLRHVCGLWTPRTWRRWRTVAPRCARGWRRWVWTYIPHFNRPCTVPWRMGLFFWNSLHVPQFYTPHASAPHRKRTWEEEALFDWEPVRCPTLPRAPRSQHRAKADAINEEEALFGWEPSEWPRVGELLKELGPYSSLWQIASDLTLREETWMHENVQVCPVPVSRCELQLSVPLCLAPPVCPAPPPLCQMPTLCSLYSSPLCDLSFPSL